MLQSSKVALLQCYAATLFNVLCSNDTTTGGRECVYLHAQNLAKTKEINCCTEWVSRSGALVSGAFWPEPLQNRSKSIGFYSVQERFGVPLSGR